MSFIKNNQGFTLIQLIVTVAIILVLAATILFGEDTLSRTGKAKDVQRYQDVTAIAKAVELYQLDNDSLPTSIGAVVIADGEKIVLCSSATSLECDGQTLGCLEVNDTDFLEAYLGGSLPLDPEKTVGDNHTGYYISRSIDKMSFGACTNYEGNDIEYIAKATVGSSCGNGTVDGSEVCDDANLINEGCGNGVLEEETTDGNNCNSTCTAFLDDTINEACDYIGWWNDCDSIASPGTYYTRATPGNVDYCNITCTASHTTAQCYLLPGDDD